MDEPLVWYEGAGTSDRRHLAADNQGSVIAASAAGVTRYAYGPYGEPDSWVGGRFRYTGQIALSEVALYHYKARVYDPVLGRFLQTDPVGYQDQMNLYTYVGNDPLNGTDPSGRDCVSSKGTTTCETANYKLSFPTPKGFQDFKSTDKNYHQYNTKVNVGNADPKKNGGLGEEQPDTRVSTTSNQGWRIQRCHARNWFPFWDNKSGGFLCEHE